MAGVLPGVKSARRRRIHQRGGGGGGGWLDFSAGGLGSGHDCSRRFCAFSVVERSGMKWTCEDDMLGRLAREAKERLDERLRAQRSSLIKRNNSDGSGDRVMCINGRRRELKTEVFGSRKKRALLRWATRISGRKWRESAAAAEEEECAVCLEDFKLEKGKQRIIEEVAETEANQLKNEQIQQAQNQLTQQHQNTDHQNLPAVQNQINQSQGIEMENQQQPPNIQLEEDSFRTGNAGTSLTEQMKVVNVEDEYEATKKKKTRDIADTASTNSKRAKYSEYEDEDDE